MKTICQQYMDQIRTLFPVIKKQEKIYLQKMLVQVEDFCEESKVTSLEDLYKRFASPEDVVREYFSVMDTDEVVTRIKRTKLFRTLVVCIIIVTLAISTTAATKTVLYYKAYQKTLDSIDGFWKDTIE